jgi:hypothetical protein
MQSASTRSERVGDATRGGDCGGDEAARAGNAATRLGNTSEASRVLWCTNSTTNDRGVQLTSRRSSWTTSSRRNSGGSEESKAAEEARVSAPVAHEARVARARVGKDPGAARP